jgi:hypothetical protein
MMRLILGIALLAGVSAGQDGAQSKPAPEAPKEVYPFFRDAEMKLMLDYYRPGSGHVPPGLVKGGPGISPAQQRQLKVTAVLPAGLDKRLEPLPAELDRRLNPVPSGYRRMVCGSSALLLQDSTNLIVDALELIPR